MLMMSILSLHLLLVLLILLINFLIVQVHLFESMVSPYLFQAMKLISQFIDSTTSSFSEDFIINDNVSSDVARQLLSIR